MPTAKWINSFRVFTKLFSITNSLMCFGRSYLAIKDILQSWYHSFATTVSQLKMCDFSGETFEGLKYYNFLWVQRYNCSPAASFANCIMTLYLLKVHLQTFLSTPITQKCQILSCDTLVANQRYVKLTTYWHLVLSLRINGTPLHHLSSPHN